MTNVVILQRVVPSYRLPVYEQIWRELGWTVAYGRNLTTEGMSLQADLPFLKGFDFGRGKGGMIKVPVKRIIKELKPDAIIAEGALRMTSTWELIARRRFMGGPKIYFWSIGYNPARQADGGRQWLYPAAYRHADGCLTYGEDGRAFLVPRLGGKPVFVAHNSIDMDEIRALSETMPGMTRRGFPELVSVGRLTPGKDFVTLVDAFKLFLREFPDAHLTIIGDGPELSAVTTAAGEEVGRRIHLEGAIYRESEVARRMKRADAFVMTGRVGLSINHALGYGLPTICFRRGPNGPFHGSEIAHLRHGETGYFVDEVNAEAFARETARLFKADPELKQRRRAQIDAYVRANLSVDRMIGGFRGIDRHLRGEMADAA